MSTDTMDEVVGIFETIGQLARGEKKIEDLFDEACEEQKPTTCTKTPTCTLDPDHEGDCQSMRRIK